MPDRKIAPQIKNAVDYTLTLKPYEYFELSNGIPVYAVNAGEQDVLQIEWVFKAGNAFEEKNLIAAATNFLLKNGTRNRTAFQINEHFEYFGSFLNRSCFSETASVSLHCLKKHLQELLPVVAEILMESVLPEPEVDLYRQNQKQRLKVNLKKCDFVANRKMDVLLFGEDHPYGKFSSFEDYDALDREELLNFYREFYLNGDCMIFLAGKLPADIQSMLDRYFGTLPVNHRKLKFPVNPIHPSGEKREMFINDPDGVQAAIRICRPFPNRHDPDFMKMQVLNTIFGGYFGSRLMSNIREEKGYTYGIQSFLLNYIQTSGLIISTEAGRDVAEATINEVYKEMELLCQEEVDDEELDLVRNYLIGTLLGDLDGPFHIIGRWKNYILNGLNDDYFYKSIDTIRSITAGELMDLARKHFQKDAFYELTVI